MRRVSGKAGTANTDSVRDYLGFFVYPDDAADLKGHKFFAGVDWDNLHLTRPPYVPQVKNNEDTTYFDEEEPLSDVDDAPSTTSIQEDDLRAQEAFEEAVAAEYAAKEAGDAGEAGPHEQANLDGAGNLHNLFGARSANNSQKTVVTTTKVLRKGAKEKKRPRDRVLRDRAVAKQVMDLRKKGAFLGYTYRRPRGVLMGLELKRAGLGSLSSGGMVPGADGLGADLEGVPFRQERRRGRSSAT